MQKSILQMNVVYDVFSFTLTEFQVPLEKNDHFMGQVAIKETHEKQINDDTANEVVNMFKNPYPLHQTDCFFFLGLHTNRNSVISRHRSGIRLCGQTIVHTTKAPSSDKGSENSAATESKIVKAIF